MRTGIHPPYHLATVTCACGNTFQTRSTLREIKLEICSACHPFYTGVQKLIDTAGRVERFQKRFSKTGGRMVERKRRPVAAAIKTASITAKTKKVLTTAPTKAGAAPKAKGGKVPKKA